MFKRLPLHGIPDTPMLAHLQAFPPTVATPRNASVGYPWDFRVSREMIESALWHEERSDAGPIVWTDLLFSVSDIEKKWARGAGRCKLQQTVRPVKMTAAMEALRALYPSKAESPRLNEQLSAIAAKVNERLWEQGHPLTEKLAKGSDIVAADTVDRAIVKLWPKA